MLLGIGLIAGAASISANARDVQLDYIHNDTDRQCEYILDPPSGITVTDEEEEQCQFILRLRNNQAVAAVSFCKCMYVTGPAKSRHIYTSFTCSEMV